MSFKVKEKEHKVAPNNTDNDWSFRKILPRIVQSYSSFFTVNKKADIYTGEEEIPFEQRHPTYKALMKLEFQDIMRQFESK